MNRAAHSHAPLILNRIPIAAPEGYNPARPYFALAQGRAFDVRNATAETAEIDLYDEIGFWGISAKAFKEQLRQVTAKKITLRINSPGGDVFDGIAIHNDLLDHPAKVDVVVTGIAASAASLIAMAGNRITMAQSAFLMIHNAWAVGIGDRNAMTDLAQTLGTIDAALARAYAARTGLAEKDIASMMDDETWLDGPAAVEKGFADKTAEAETGSQARAWFDLSGFRNLPSALKGQSRPSAGPTTRDLERGLRDAGASREAAKEILSRGIGSQNQRDAGADADFAAGLSGLVQAIRA